MTPNIVIEGERLFRAAGASNLSTQPPRVVGWTAPVRTGTAGHTALACGLLGHPSSLSWADVGFYTAGASRSRMGLGVYDTIVIIRNPQTSVGNYLSPNISGERAKWLLMGLGSLRALRL